MNNDHERALKKLPLAAAGALDANELRAIQKHTGQCDACRRELERWGVYTHQLKQLPQPAVPPGLIERTQALIVEAQAAAAARRSLDLTIAALAAFGWALSFGLFAVASVIVGGINPLVWSAAWTALAWLTAGSAVAILGHERLIGRML
jgi:anti-sigma factor RsiW